MPCYSTKRMGGGGERGGGVDAGQQISLPVLGPNTEYWWMCVGEDL